MLIDNFNLKARNFLTGLFVGAVSGAGQRLENAPAEHLLQQETASGGRLNRAAMTDSDENADAIERFAKQ